MVTHYLKKSSGCSNKLIVLKIPDILVAYTFVFWIVSDNCPTTKIPSRSGLEFCSKLGLFLGLGTTRQLPPAVRVRVWLRVNFWVGGSDPRGTILLEPFWKWECFEYIGRLNFLYLHFYTRFLINCSILDILQGL